jgi:hypothetical protein
MQRRILSFWLGTVVLGLYYCLISRWIMGTSCPVAGVSFGVEGRDKRLYGEIFIWDGGGRAGFVLKGCAAGH